MSKTCFYLRHKISKNHCSTTRGKVNIIHEDTYEGISKYVHSVNSKVCGFISFTLIYLLNVNFVIS